MTKKLSPLICFLCFSCSHYISFLDNNKNPKLIDLNQPQLSCSKTRPLQFVHRDQLVIKSFEKTIDKIELKTKLSFLEKAALWTLFQLTIRPDSTNLNTRFQVAYGTQEKSTLIDFNHLNKNNKNLNLLTALESLLSKDPRNKSVRRLLLLADFYFPKKVPMTKEFSHFVKKNKKRLIQKKFLKSSFFRAEQSLEAGESIPRFSMKKLLPFSRKTAIIQRGPIFPFLININNKKPTPSIQCNQDLGLYENSIFLIDPQDHYSVNSFAIYSQDGNFFIASTKSINSLKSKKLNIPGTYLFNSQAAHIQSPYCIINKTQTNERLILLALNDRDPGQHLFHLLRNGIQYSSSTSEIEEYIKYPRHQILQNPNRILFEGHRGQESQLKSFLALNFPIYNAENLGEIWALANFSSRGQLMITDERYPTHQSCFED